MFKENGREKPADTKETASSKGKTFKCWKCGHEEVRRNVEFGGNIPCPKCGRGTLHEDV